MLNLYRFLHLNSIHFNRLLLIKYEILLLTFKFLNSVQEFLFIRSKLVSQPIENYIRIYLQWKLK